MNSNERLAEHSELLTPGDSQYNTVSIVLKFIIIVTVTPVLF